MHVPKASGSQERHNLRLPWLPGEFEQRKSDRQVEAAGPCTAWVQVKDPSLIALADLMRVTADDRVEASGLRVEVEILEIVKHIKTEAICFDDRRDWKFLRPGLGVYVAAHGKHRSDEFELRENFRSAHISRMDNQLHPGQGALRFRAEQTVSIGNDADPHGGCKNT